MGELLDLVLHLDAHVALLVHTAGPWAYLVLFAVIFCETGLVVTPFLPGDSLLFAAGAVAALGGLDIDLLARLLFVAAVAGDAVNYAIGKRVGRRAAHRWARPEHLARTEAFFARHGGKAVVLARFAPIVRTLAPFVAGMGAMSYWKFTLYNLLGAGLWVGGFVYAGYFFGAVPFVQEHFTLFVLGIIVLSVLPVLVRVVPFGRLVPVRAASREAA
ncbi:MAG: DedA family protein [Rhodothermales bacterium]